jgi:hypothetical protein
MWRSKERPTRALWAVEGGMDRRVEQVAERGRAAGGAQDLRGGGMQREKNREKLGFGEDEGDLVVKNRKLRGLTVKYR